MTSTLLVAVPQQLFTHSMWYIHTGELDSHVPNTAHLVSKSNWVILLWIILYAIVIVPCHNNRGKEISAERHWIEDHSILLLDLSGGGNLKWNDNNGAHEKALKREVNQRQRWYHVYQTSLPCRAVSVLVERLWARKKGYNHWGWRGRYWRRTREWLKRTEWERE